MGLIHPKINAGSVIIGKQELTKASISGHLAEFMECVDAARRLTVLANADTPDDARAARANGAQGIGLVRTEHMFFGSPARISAVRTMIGAVQVRAFLCASLLVLRFYDISWSYQMLFVRSIFGSIDE